MQLLEKSVTLEKADDIFGIIAQVLYDNIHTQVYVCDSIIQELECNHISHSISFPNLIQCSHYVDGEKWYKYSKGYVLEPTIALASFISNCVGYKQLVEFKIEGLKYCHVAAKMQQILVIHVR